jgi:FkbM family methyltransferase
VNLARLPADRWYGRLLRWPLRWIPRETTVRVLQGPLRGARWVVGSHTHGCWFGTYELARQQALVRLVRPGAVVYDLGANAGFYTLLAARLAGPAGAVLAFEPLPRNLEYLRRHVLLNRCTNVTVVEAAVADRSGEARLATNDAATASLRADGAIVVRTVTLDDMVFERHVRPPSLLKVDVEGAELAVLHGAGRVMKTFRPVVVLSTHDLDLRRECQRLLASWGYMLGAEETGRSPAEVDEVIAIPA